MLAATLVPVDVFLAFNDELVHRGDYKQFWSMLPTIWKNLYSEGEARVRTDGDWLDIELDCPVAHVYFEISTMAFVRHALEMKAGRRGEIRRLSRVGRGGQKGQYQFILQPTERPAQRFRLTCARKNL